MYILSKDFRIEVRRSHKEERDKSERIKIMESGTPEEKIEYHNKQSPNYQMMTDDEVREKYEGLDFDKVSIVDHPTFIYNIDEMKILNDQKDYYEVNSDNHFVIKPGNRQVAVDCYSELDLDTLNTKEGIAIYRHKTDNYRYKVSDDVE